MGNSEVESTHREPAKPCQSLNVSPRATPRVRSQLSYPLKIRSSALRAKCIVQKVKNLTWIQLVFANEDTKDRTLLVVLISKLLETSR